MLAGAFKCAHVTALAWVHLLLLDIVQARWVNESHMHCALDKEALSQACNLPDSIPMPEHEIGVHPTVEQRQVQVRHGHGVGEILLLLKSMPRSVSQPGKLCQPPCQFSAAEHDRSSMVVLPPPVRMLCCACREVWMDGLKHGVATGHSVILCFMFGPLGMLSHMVTKKAFSSRQQEPQAATAQGPA